MRRRVVRPVFWALAVLAVLALAAVRLVTSDYLAERGRRWVEERLESALGREVRVEALELDPLPLTIELRGLEIGGSRPGEPPFASVERVLVEGRWLRWRSGSLALGRVLIEEPLVRLIQYEDGTENSRFGRRSPGAPRARPPAELSIRELTIRGGAIEVERRRVPVNVSGRRLRATLLGGGGLDVSGRVEVDDVELLLPDARPFLGTVAARVVAGPEGLRLTSGRVSGPELEAEVSGEWTWLEERRLELDFEARANGALLDELGYTKGEVRGPFRFVGGLAWRPRLWGFRGTLTSGGSELFGRRVSGLVAEVAGDRNAIRADITGAGYGGGRIRGEAAYRLLDDGRPFDLRLDLEEVSLARILADQKIPLTGIDGRVSGPFEYSFPVRSPERGDGRAQVELEAGPLPEENLQFAGAASLTFDRGILTSDSIRLVSDSHHALVALEYDIPARSGRVVLEIGTERIEELVPLLPISAETLESAAWAPTSGTGRVGGTLLLTRRGTASQVRLDLADFVAPGGSADRVQGALSVAGSGIQDLRIELLRPNGAAIVTGSIPFDGATVGEDETGAVPFAIGVDAAGWPSSDVESWFPLGLDVAGPVGGSLSLSGDPEAPEGRIDAVVAPAVVANLDADSVALELDFDESRLRFARVDAVTPAGRVGLTGTLERATGVMDLQVESDALDLGQAPFAGLLPGASGRVEAEARFRGTVERPRVDAELTWLEFSLGGVPVTAPARTRLELDGSELVLSGSLPALPSVSGTGRLDVDGFEVDVEVAIDDLEPALAILDYPPLDAVSGSLAGVVSARGRFGAAVAPRIDLRLDRLELTRSGVTLRSAEPVIARLGAGGLELQSLFLTTEDEASELFVAGRIELDAERRLDLTAQASLGADWLDLLVPEVRVSGGRFDLLAAIGGTMARPRLNGVGRLESASVLLGAVATSLEGLEGLVLLYPDRIVLDSVRARTGGGTVEAGGSVRLGADESPLTYHLDAVASGLNLAYPEGWQLRGDARVSLVSTAAGRLVQGDVDLERAYYFSPIKLGLQSALEGLVQRRRIEVRETSELMATTALNVRIRGREALAVRNNVASLGGDIDFSVRGTLADPVLFGSVDISPGGTLVYAGNEYEIERGELDFANPYRIEPIVDLLATTKLREYVVRLNLAGSPDRLEVSVSSNPPLPELDVLGLLTGGTTPQGFTPTDRRQTEAGLGVEGFLAGEAASVVTDRVNRLFGLDQLRVSPLTGSSSDLSSARVTVGERVSRDLFATYSYDPSTSEEQILQLEWSVSPTLVVVATQNGDESYSIDLRWEKSF